MHLEKFIHGISYNCWPSKEVLYHKGWLIRVSDGFTKRANSVFIQGVIEDLRKEDVTFVEQVYKKSHLPVIFQIPDIFSDMTLDSHLAMHGYIKESPTVVKILEFSDGNAYPEIQTDYNIEIKTSISSDWLSKYQKVGHLSGTSIIRLENILNRIRIPNTLYYTVNDHNQVIGSALSISLYHYTLVVNLMVNEARRRQGIGELLMRKILHDAFISEEKGVYLQVMKNNLPAIKLYEKLGFVDLYSYHYRIKRLK